MPWNLNILLKSLMFAFLGFLIGIVSTIIYLAVDVDLSKLNGLFYVTVVLSGITMWYAYFLNQNKKLLKYWSQIKLKLSKPLFQIIHENPIPTVLVFSIVGLYLSSHYKLTMDKDAWFWFFSSIAQTLAALIALIAIFLIFRVESYNLQINNKYEILRVIINDIINDKESIYFAASNELLKSDSKTLYLNLDPREAVLWGNAMNEISNIEHKKEKFKTNFQNIFRNSLVIVLVSIMILPLGSVSTDKIFDTISLWNDWKLKWLILYGVVGYCIVIIYQIAYGLGEFFKDV